MLVLCNSCKKAIIATSRNKALKELFYSTCKVSALDQAYVPHKVEDETTGSNYFKPTLKDGQHFSLILPPPNITGNLHLGHALTGTIQDILVRWKQMQGIETLWVPGLDHAGIATQVIVEKQLWKEEKKTRHDISKKKFQDKVWEWKKEKSRSIDDQLKRLGLSLNWNKQVFTMDPDQVEAVSKVFVNLFDKGLIYRNESLVNWSCFLRSAISDIEVDHLQIDGSTAVNVPGYEKPVQFGRLIKFAYKIVDSDDEIVVATTRPETVLGDVAVAIHPADDRYGRFVGKEVWHPFRHERIPIIADEFVDMNFETGAVKITPGHDHTDFAVAKRHSLYALQVFDEKGNVTDISQEFQSLRRFDVRNLIIDRLEHLNLLRDIKEHKMSVPICSRSGDVVEFLLRPQWFVNCQEMAQRALNAVKHGELVIEPKHFEDRWFDWLENIRDWCISRQLWWGHRIPAYLCSVENNERWVAGTDLESVRRKASIIFDVAEDVIKIEQDSDVLDTWFSSALLPFSVFKWPNITGDLAKYYPLSLMETGHDILFFWVARMVMLGTEITGQLPFEKVLLHGVVCDSKGRKMSKSLGNVIPPENVIDGITLQELNQTALSSERAGILSSAELKKTLQEQKKMFPEGIPECGTDALRFTLVSHNIKSHFINFDVQECYANKLFCNKIWQATKFTKLWYEKVTEVQGVDNINQQNIRIMDQWILSKYSNLVQVTNESLENCDFHVATQALKDFMYFHFCDVYLETAKRGLREVGTKTAAGHCWTLLTVLDGGLRALHPFMPYVTVHLHQRIPSVGLMQVSYPKKAEWRNEELERTVENILEIVKSIRRLRKMFNVTKKHDSQVQIVTPTTEYLNFKEVIEDLSNCGPILFDTHLKEQVNSNLVKDVLSNNATVYLSIPEELRSNLRMDQSKLEKKRDKLNKELLHFHDMMSGSTYKNNATMEAQKIHEKKVAVLEERIARIDSVLSIL